MATEADARVWKEAVDKLVELCKEATVQLRKGEVIEKKVVGNVNVTDVYLMPHESEVNDSLVKIDMEFIKVGVKKKIAEEKKPTFIEICESYPEPDRLVGGPSYIEVGAEVGDQGLALQMFAVGEVLGLWEVITPTRLGITGAKAQELAGKGFIMISGYRSKK